MAPATAERRRQTSSESALDDNEGASEKKRRRVGATCDVCRQRKVRCELDTDQQPGEGRCRVCLRLELPCTWVGNLSRKKRGPKLKYKSDADQPVTLSLLSEAAAQARPAPPRGVGDSPVVLQEATLAPHRRASSSVSPRFRHAALPGSSGVGSLSLAASSATQPTAPFADSHGIGSSASGMAPVLSADFSGANSGLPISSLGTLLNDSSSQALIGSSNLFSIFSPAGTNVSASAVSDRHLVNPPLAMAPTSQVSASRICTPTPTVPPLELLAPVWRVRAWLVLWFDYRAPLTPLCHRPSFLQAFDRGEYMSRPSFFALICAMVSNALLTAPSSVLDMQVPEARRVAAYANGLSRETTIKEGFDPPHLEWAIARYLDLCYHSESGHLVTSTTCHADSWAIAAFLQLDRPESTEGLNVIEIELRRRLLWILFSSDKDFSLLAGCSPRVHLQFGDIPFPAEVDDEQISATGIDWSSQSSPSLLSGFNVLSKIYVVLADLLPIIRADHLKPVEGSVLFAQIEQVKQLEKQLNESLASAPPMYHLRRRSRGEGSPSHIAAPPSIDTMSWLGVDAPEPDFSALLAELLASEPPSLVADVQTQRKHAVSVQQANVSVTYLVVLLELMKHQQSLLHRLTPHIPRNSIVFVSIANAMLDALLCVPIEAVATNGISVVRKVRHIVQALPALTDLETAQGFISDYLGVVERIEVHWGLR